MNKPHDHLFKSTFSDKRIAKDYIRNFLPTDLTSKLDLNSLELSATSYVNSDLKESMSDVVYRCTYGSESLILSLLFEHKSSPEGIIHLQLLRYMLGAWDQQVDKKEELRIVVPIVVYHGRGQWKKRNFSSHFRGLDETLRPFIPEFEYLNTHIQDWTDEALMTLQAGLVRNLMLLLKHYRDEAYTVQHIERLFIDIEQHFEDSTQKPHIKRFWVYLWNTNELKDEEFRNLFNRLPTHVKNEAMTTYEQIIQKGEARGIQKGKIEGKIEGTIETENLMITNAFRKGLDLSLIAELTGLSESEVKDRIKELRLEG